MIFPTLKFPIVKYINTDCGFWLQWLLVTLCGFLVSLYLIEVDVRPYIGVYEGVIGGAVVGLAQGSILRQRSKTIALWWILVSIVSWGFIGASHFGAVGWIAPRTLRLEPRVIFGVLNGLQVGALLGIGQWFVLRTRWQKAGLWVLVSAGAWAIGLPVGWAVGGILRQATRLFLSELVGLAVAWIAIASITGIALIWVEKSYGIKQTSKF